MDDTTPLPIAVLNFPEDHKSFLISAKFVSTSLTGNTYFTSLATTVVSLNTEIAAMDLAMTKAKGRAPGAASDCKAKRRKVTQRLNHIVDTVQGIIETTANPADAATMILSAGLKIKKVGKHNKAPLSAQHGAATGEVSLIALAVARRATYFWEYSSDGMSWEKASPTHQSKTALSGLKPGLTYHYRFRALTKLGESDYSDVVSLIVH